MDQEKGVTVYCKEEAHLIQKIHRLKIKRTEKRSPYIRNLEKGRGSYTICRKKQKTNKKTSRQD